MRIREENCNMILLAVVTTISVVIAGGAMLMGPADDNPSRFADRTAANVATPSTSVPPAVASDAIVDQSAMRDEPRAADLAHPMTWSGD